MVVYARDGIYNAGLASSFILWQNFYVASVDCTEILKALADRTRQRIVKVLLVADASVNELTERLDLSQYNTSKHLRVLKEAGIVEVRAIGQRREYSIAGLLRKRLQKEGNTLDFGCCSFDFAKLAG